MTLANKTYTSPDGALTFVSQESQNGTIVLSFKDYPWHTHADLLVPEYGDSEQAAMQKFVSDLLEDRLIIAIYKKDGEISDIGITDDALADLKYLPSEEEIDFRYWSGAKWEYR